jgi:undecaprenyl-diphosphatase
LYITDVGLRGDPAVGVSQLTYPEAILVGLIQGVTELFPVSSLGHAVLIPAMIGGSWATDLSLTADKSPYLTFLVAVHVATAVALVIFFRRDWARIIAGLVTSIRYRRIDNSDQRLAWLLLVATVPVGAAGIALDHALRTTLGKPGPASVFLILNGIVLLTAERLRRKNSPTSVLPRPVPIGPRPRKAGHGQLYASTSYRTDRNRGVSAGHGDDADAAIASDHRLSQQSWTQGILIGAAQIFALFPGISRSGTTISAGLLRGLSHEDAARFAFLLATPVIAGAGLFKLPELAGQQDHSIVGQVLAGSLVAGVGAYLSLRFLTRYFETRTLTPFAIYCLIAGTIAFAWTVFP